MYLSEFEINKGTIFQCQYQFTTVLAGLGKYLIIWTLIRHNNFAHSYQSGKVTRRPAISTVGNLSGDFEFHCDAQVFFQELQVQTIKRRDCNRYSHIEVSWFTIPFRVKIMDIIKTESELPNTSCLFFRRFWDIVNFSFNINNRHWYGFLICLFFELF